MKKAKHGILVLVALVVLIVIAQLVFYWATELTRAAKIAQIKKPASILAYEQLAAKLDEPSGRQPTPQTEGSEKGDATRPAALPDDPEETIALSERFCKDIRDVYFRLFEVLDSGKFEPQTWSDDYLVKVSQFLREIQPVIDQIRELSRRSGPLYPLDFSKSEIEVAPHLSEMYMCAMLLQADATVKAADGDYRGAVENIFAGMRLADALAQEPLLLSQLMRVQIHVDMNAALQQCIDVKDLPPGILEELLSYMARSDNRQAFAESFAGSQLAVHNWFSDLRTGDLESDLREREPFAGDVGEVLNEPFMWFYASPFGRPWMNMDENAVASTLNRVAAVADLPYYEARSELDRIEYDIKGLPRTRVIASGMVTYIRKPLLGQAVHEASLDLAQMGLLVEQYQAQHGSYPDTLDAIALSLDGSLPIDPFTGDPYHYAPSDDSFQLYSVGINLTDDGGIHHDNWKEGDIVWRGGAR